MDNLNIHGCKSFIDRYGKKEGTALWNRLTVHYTPKHGSWLDQAEIEISLYARQCLGNRRIPDLATPPTGITSLDSASEPRSRQNQLEIKSP